MADTAQRKQRKSKPLVEPTRPPPDADEATMRTYRSEYDRYAHLLYQRNYYIRTKEQQKAKRCGQKSQVISITKEELQAMIDEAVRKVAATVVTQPST